MLMEVLYTSLDFTTHTCSTFSTLIIQPSHLQLSTSKVLWASGRAKIIISTSTPNNCMRCKERIYITYFVQIDFIFHKNIKLVFVPYLQPMHWVCCPDLICC